MSLYDNVSSVLIPYFHDEFYRDGVAALKRDISAHEDYGRAWRAIATAIQNRELQSGEALDLVNYKANQVLEENTDEEAYRWLDLMVRNVERTDGVIEEYPPRNIIL